ncbi:MAG: nitroreductase family protein [Phycisphaerales bacterium]|nr:nitroreductase family protein [Phycisphaerales bacterium]
MELFEAIQQRRSYRGEFLPKPVRREDIEKILAAGAAAPSGCNKELTEFVVVDAPDKRAAIVAMFPDKVFIRTAPAFIVIVSDPTPVYEDKTFELADSAAVTQNVLLAIAALGYATVWFDGYLRGGADIKIAELLGIPSPKVARILLPIGRPAAEVTAKQKKPWQSRTHWNKW